MRIIGLDIGGANVKAADNDGNASCVPFAVWKAPEGLADVLADLLRRFAPIHAIAVTMTAELADCFETKAEGVDRILTSLESAAPDVPLLVWQTGGEFVPPEVAREFPLLAAAANWHALASFAGRIAPNDAAMLIDIGSTTTDIIPLSDGLPATQGLTDVERLLSGELVYTGVRRTPVCAVAGSVPFRDATLRPAAELFATMQDIYLILGLLPEEPANTETANGRPATSAASRDRLARALCCDRTEISDEELLAVASHLYEQQKQTLNDAVSRVVSSRHSVCRHLILSGSGEFLARAVAEEHPAFQAADRSSLSAMLSADVAEAACAFAVAKLAAEQGPGRWP